MKAEIAAELVGCTWQGHATQRKGHISGVTEREIVSAFSNSFKILGEETNDVINEHVFFL